MGFSYLINSNASGPWPVFKNWCSHLYYTGTPWHSNTNTAQVVEVVVTVVVSAVVVTAAVVVVSAMHFERIVVVADLSHKLSLHVCGNSEFVNSHYGFTLFFCCQPSLWHGTTARTPWADTRSSTQFHRWCVANLWVLWNTKEDDAEMRRMQTRSLLWLKLPTKALEGSSTLKSFSM